MGGRHNSNRPVITPSYTGLQLQTSSNAIPIAIVWGTNRIAPNIIWNDDFAALPQYSANPRSGKGGGGGTTYSVSGYNYQTAIVLALCEGPIDDIGTAWQGQSTYNLEDLQLSMFTGSSFQSAWGYLSSRHIDKALTYPGLAYLASSNFSLGSSASLGLNWVEVQGRLSGSTALNEFDADPALIIEDLLINAQYGVGFPAASIHAATLFGEAEGSSYQTYCAAAGLALSPALVNQESANAVLNRWLQLTNATAIWSGGFLKILSFGDEPISGNGTSFIPNLEPVYDLTDDDFIYSEGEEPLVISRQDPYVAYNMQSLEYSDRSNDYAATPVTVFDQNAIDSFGLRIASSVSAHDICEYDVAMRAAQLILQRGLYVRSQFSFKLSWEYCLLEPMDIVTVSDKALGLDHAPVRILEIAEDDDGLLSVTAEECPEGVGTAFTYGMQESSGQNIERNVPANPVNPPLIFEPPTAITVSGKAEVWIGASGGDGVTHDAFWGGAFLWVSLDGARYSSIGLLSKPLRHGVLGEALEAASLPQSDHHPFLINDTSSHLRVDLGQSGGSLIEGSDQSVSNGEPLAIVDAELLAFKDVSLISAGEYSLSSLARGLYGSPQSHHSTGASFARLDEAVFKYVLPDGYVGSTLYLKFQSFNVFGAGVQDLADCEAYTYKILGSGRFGGVSQALAFGSSVDCGLASEPALQTDDFGSAGDVYAAFIDLGLASS